MKKKVLVTGGLGFIGSHTVVELLNAGFEVVILDDLSNSQLFVLANIEKIAGKKSTFYMVNMQEKESLEMVFVKEPEIGTVIHFAASKAVGESVVDPLKYYRNNLFGLLNLLECMEQRNLPNIVFSSSATVYGEPDDLPVTETSKIKPSLSAYGSTKQMGEDILEKLAHTKRIKAISLRYFNPVGAHHTALLGELPLGTPNNLMPYLTQVAAGKLTKLTVYGDDYNTIDGTCIRDYVHVVDLASAHVLSCRRLAEREDIEHYEVFNIGTGKGLSVLEIINAFENFNNLKLNYEIGGRRHGDAASIYADVSKAEKILDWSAKKGIAEMVIDAWRWQQALK